MSDSRGILERIVEATRRRVHAERKRPQGARPAEFPPPACGRLRNALRRPAGEPVRFLCELKHRSPSRGVLRDPYDVEALARAYATAGAAALSVLTEPEFFGGAPEHLARARRAAERPCLRKDFLVDPWQIGESVALGADGVLLIAAALPDAALPEMLRAAHAAGLDALVETHTEEEMRRALDAGADWIGINNRDLATFEVDLATTERLRPLAGDGVVIVAESGVDGAAAAARLAAAGVDALLVGEHFMRAPDPGDALRALRAALAAHAAAGPK